MGTYGKGPNLPEDAELVQISENCVEIARGIRFLGNENGYDRDEKAILIIIDNQGREVPATWGKEWMVSLLEYRHAGGKEVRDQGGWNRHTGKR
jgi:hypothetical protein